MRPLLLKQGEGLWQETLWVAFLVAAENLVEVVVVNRQGEAIWVVVEKVLAIPERYKA